MFAAAAIIIFVVAMVPKGFATNSATGNIIAPSNGPTGDVQEATLTYENYGYVVTPSSLKAGIPVKMTVDLGSVGGCMRDVVIPAFGVRKYVSAEDNVITFTPDKTGEIRMSCSMGMGQGKFTVTEQNNKGSEPSQLPTGAAPSQQQKTGTFSEVSDADQNLPSGGSCGAGGGGCGCGGR